jgi:tetratricopeptide (TPR) repeat protein
MEQVYYSCLNLILKPFVFIIKALLLIIILIGCHPDLDAPSTSENNSRNPVTTDSLVVDQLLQRSNLFFIESGSKAEVFDSFLKEALDIAGRRNLTSQEVIIYNTIGKRYRNLSQYGEALKNHHQALTLAQSIAHVQLLADIYNQIGVVYRRTDDNAMALDMHFKALKLAEEVQDTFNISVSINSIGNVNFNLGRYHTAMEYFLRSMELSVVMDNTLGLAINNHNIGECMLKLGQPDSALVYFLKSLEYNSEIGSRAGQSICFNSIGASYIAKNDLELAQDYLERSLQINRKLGDLMQVSISLGKVGEVNLLIGNFSQAKKHLEESLSIAAQIGSRFQAEESARLLSALHEKTNDFGTSLRYYKTSTEYKDSILNEKNMYHLTTMEAMMETEIQRDKINQLSQEAQIQKSVMSRQKLILTVFIIILIVLVSVATMLVFQHRLRNKYNNLKNQHKLLRSQMNPHFIFNALSAIQVYVLENDIEKSTRFLTDFAKLMRQVLKLSHYDYISLKNESEILGYYLELQQLRFSSPFSYNIQIDASIDSDAVLVPPMITQPFVENAVEHGLKDSHENGFLNIRFKKLNTQMIIEVEDNGLGINHATQQKNDHKVKSHESMAIKITKERLDVIHNDSGGKVGLEIIDKKEVNPFDHGTLVRIILPVVEQNTSKSSKNG